MPLNEAFLQELKYKTDIADIISSYVSLKKRGSTFVGLCPFHNEKTPSFTVYPGTQSFYCFGCGAGGDAITFIKKIENLDYIDAVKLLAQRAGIQMPDDSAYDDSLSRKRRRILEINRETAKFYYSYLLSDKGADGIKYYAERGISANTIKRFGLGYAPNEWNALLNHLKSKGFKPSEMVDAGVVRISQKSNSYYDYFRNRVITPIIDVRGNVVAFGGRVLDDSKPKYINSPDTLVYKKTNEVFALNIAKDHCADSLILCEGYMDVIAMNQAGFKNAVAGCGTALTSEQVSLISRYTKEVILAYDADEAGQKALAKAINLFKRTDIKIKVPTLIGGKDPDEIINKFGRDKFKGMLEGASNEIEYALLKLKNGIYLETTQGKIDFLNSAIKILADVSPIEQDLYLTRLSNELGVEKSGLRAQLNDYIKKKKRYSKRTENKAIINDSIRKNNKTATENDSSIKQVKAERRMLELLIMYPDCRKLCEGFDSEKILSPFIKHAFAQIISRLDKGLDIDIMDLSQSLTEDELSELTGLIAGFCKSDNSKAEFEDCLKTICQEYDKKHKSSAGEMSDDDFRKLFNNG